MLVDLAQGILALGNAMRLACDSFP